MPGIAGIAGLPAGDADTVEAITIAALGRVRARRAVPAARGADALEALALTAIGGGSADRAIRVAGAARAVDAHGLAVEQAALGGDGAGTARRLALAYATDTGADAAIGITGAGDAIRPARIRQHLGARRARRVAGIPEAALRVGLARGRVGALGASWIVAQQERAHAARQCLQHTAARSP